MTDNIKVGVGLQVCRPNKLSGLVYQLSLIEKLGQFHVEIVVDRNSPEIDLLLHESGLSTTFTNGIGNWTSKNFLVRKLLESNSDIIILLEDDVEILREGMFEYVRNCYNLTGGFLGYFKLNTDHHRTKRQQLLIGQKSLNGVDFELFRDLNTSALLVFGRHIVDRIGFFCNSFYEVGFHDYRRRLYGAKLIDEFLVPSGIYDYVAVDDSIPSTVSAAESAIYWSQKFEECDNWYRPYNDVPALKIGERD